MTKKLFLCLVDFFSAMACKLILQASRGRHGWDGMDVFQILERLDGELVELREAYDRGDWPALRGEAVDVANFAMFLHYRASKAGGP